MEYESKTVGAAGAVMADTNETSPYISTDILHSWSALYDDVTGAITTQIGKNASRREREQLQLTDPSLVYGEISFNSFAAALLKIKYKYGLPGVGNSPMVGGIMQRDGGIFVDIGGGTGKALVAASIIHNFEHAYSIELLEGLHTLAVDIISNFNSKGKTALENMGRVSSTTCAAYHGDMLNMSYKDWRHADVVFANSTCFDENLMLKIAETAQPMRRGSFFITFTRPLPGEDWTILEHGLHMMSWGTATVYIHQKQTAPSGI